MVEELHISVKQGTDVGKVRDHNEDFVLIPEVSEAERNSKGRLFIVADGMGGYQAGEVASEMAARTVAQRYYADPSDDPSTRLRNAVQAANAEVHLQAQGNIARTGMGTTMVVAALVGRQAYIASVGDSRAYVVHNGRLDQITQDHSFVGEQVRAGILTKEQARLHPQRNVITRALGSQPTVSVDTFRGDLSDGDVLVMCTDGLTGHVPDEQIRDTVLQLSPEQAVPKLIQTANEGGGSDNITLIVLRAELPISGKTQTVATPASSLHADSTVAPAPGAGGTPSAKPAMKPAAKPVKGGSNLFWILGGVMIVLIVVVVAGASVVVFDLLPGGKPKVTPTSAPPSPSPLVPSTVTPLVAPATTSVSGAVTATFAPTPLPPSPTKPIIRPTTAAPSETPTAEVTPTPLATETPQPDKGPKGGGGGGHD